MKTKVALISLIMATFTAKAEIYPEAAPCDPSPFGSFCEIHPKILPNKKFNQYALCGRTVVAITAKQRKVLNAYLKENKNMILRFKIDDEYVDAPCD